MKAHRQCDAAPAPAASRGAHLMQNDKSATSVNITKRKIKNKNYAESRKAKKEKKRKERKVEKVSRRRRRRRVEQVNKNYALFGCQ